MTLEPWDVALRLGMALVLGAAIGLERQWHLKMAGLRTNALVSLGAGCFVVCGGPDPRTQEVRRHSGPLAY